MPSMASSTNGPTIEAGPWPRARTTAASRKASCSSDEAGRAAQVEVLVEDRHGGAEQLAGRGGEAGIAAALHQGAAQREAGAGGPGRARAAGDGGGHGREHGPPGRDGGQHDDRHAERRARAGGGRRRPRTPRAASRAARPGSRRRRLISSGASASASHEGRHGRSSTARGGTTRAPAQRRAGRADRRGGCGRPARAAARMSVVIVRTMGPRRAGFKRSAAGGPWFVQRAKDRSVRLALGHKAPGRGARRIIRRCPSPEKEGLPRHAESSREQRRRRSVEPERIDRRSVT